MSKGEDRIPYADQKAWEDVKPIPQYDTFNPVAPIFYHDDYKEATSYLRAVMANKEYSQRVLDLTLHIINMNPGHYTVWQYRWATLKALSSDLQEEQTLTESISVEFLKNYQVWHHRRLLLLELKNPLPELLFLITVLQADAKNYHTWAYRQWILSEFGYHLDENAWNTEMDFTEEMIDDDVRNNSAWHHRFFIVWLNGAREGDHDRRAVLRRELRYVKTKISVAPNNLSAWNYLRGILDKTNTPYSELVPFATPYAASEFKPLTTNEIDLDNPAPGQGAQLPCVYALEFIADGLANDATKGKEEPGKAIEYYKSLAGEHDVAHRNYWNYRISEMDQLRQLQAEA